MKFYFNPLDTIIKDKDWNGDALEFWEKIQSSGKIKYTIKYGVCAWGGYMSFMMLIFTIIHPYINPNANHLSLSEIIPLVVLVSTLGGVLYCHISWIKNNNSYKRYKDSLRK